MTKAALDVLEYPEIAADLVARGQANAKRYTRGRWFAAHQALYRELT
jgi:hypothetical protein